MSQPWLPEMVISDKKARQLIERQFPNLKPVNIKVLGEGFDNSVFLINGEYVFRFPRRDIAAALIQTENRLLPVICPSLPLSIPNPLFLGNPDGNYKWPFSGYEKLNGKNPTGLTAEQRMQSAEPLALFLKKLHTLPITEDKKLEVPYDQLDRMNIEKRKPRLMDNIQKARQLEVVDQSLIEKAEKFISNLMLPPKKENLTLVHGDLHFRNMLVDENQKVSAVIDWGDTHIDHPAIDLSIVYSFLPYEGRAKFFSLYGEVRPDIKDMARFRAIYTATLLLLYALDQKDEEFINESQVSLNLALS